MTNIQKRLTISKPIKHILRFAKCQLGLYISIVEIRHEKTPNHFGWRFFVYLLVLTDFRIVTNDCIAKEF